MHKLALFVVDDALLLRHATFNKFCYGLRSEDQAATAESRILSQPGVAGRVQ